MALTFSCLLVKNDTPVHKNDHSGQGIQDLDDILKLCGCIQRIGRKIEALWVHPANWLFAFDESLMKYEEFQNRVYKTNVISITFCFCLKSPAIWPIHPPDFTTCTQKCYSRSKKLFWCFGRRSTLEWKCQYFIRGVVTCKSVSHVPRNNHGFQLLSHVPSHTHNSPTHFQWNSMSSNIRFSQMLWKPIYLERGYFEAPIILWRVDMKWYEN